MGKGNFKLVPVFFTQDRHGALKILSSTQIRCDIGISQKNKYFFPTTQGSDTHASGWHLVKNICNKISLQSS